MAKLTRARTPSTARCAAGVELSGKIDESGANLGSLKNKVKDQTLLSRNVLATVGKIHEAQMQSQLESLGL